MKYIEFTCGCLCKDFNVMECTSAGDAPNKGCKHYIPQEDCCVEHDGNKVFVRGDSSCSAYISTTKYKGVETNVYDMEDLSDYEDWYGFMLVTIKETKYYCREVKIDGKMIFKNGIHYDEEIKALEQEPFINKPCVSEKVCEHDKQMVLDKIRAEIDSHCSDNRDRNDGLYIAMKIIEKYKAESEGCRNDD